MTDLIPPEGGRIPPGDRSPSRDDPTPTGDDPATDREAARRIAAAHTAASRDLEALLRRLPATPGPAEVAEYAALLAREEALRAERLAATAVIGLELPSLGGGG